MGKKKKSLSSGRITRYFPLLCMRWRFKVGKRLITNSLETNLRREKGRWTSNQLQVKCFNTMSSTCCPKSGLSQPWGLGDTTEGWLSSWQSSVNAGGCQQKFYRVRGWSERKKESQDLYLSVPLSPPFPSVLTFLHRENLTDTNLFLRKCR